MSDLVRALLRSPRRILGAVALLGLLGALLLAGRSALRAWKLVHPVRYSVSTAEAATARGALAHLEDVTLHTADGLALRAWFAPGTRRAVVVFVHGLWGNRMSLEPEAAAMNRHGYGVLLYDSRCSGDSEGDTVTWGDQEQLDARAAVDYVSARKEIDPDRIAMLGFSLGGGTAAMAATLDPRVHALILHATWTTLAGDVTANHSEYGPLSLWPTFAVFRAAGIHFDHVQAVAHIAKFSPRPLLMIAGDVDEDTPPAAMRAVFAAAGPPKDFWLVSGAAHGGVYQAAPAEYETRVVSFLDHAFPIH